VLVLRECAEGMAEQQLLFGAVRSVSVMYGGAWRCDGNVELCCSYLQMMLNTCDLSKSAKNRKS
jgi:hypothetical protein